MVCICAKFGGNVKRKLFTYMGIISLELYLVHTVINTQFISLIGLPEKTALVGIIVLIGYIGISLGLSIPVKKLSNQLTKVIMR